MQDDETTRKARLERYRQQFDPESQQDSKVLNPDYDQYPNLQKRMANYFPVHVRDLTPPK